MIEIIPSTANPLETPLDLLVIACAEEQPLESPLVRAADARLDGALARAAAGQRFKGKAGQVVDLHTLGRLAAARVVLLGCGAGTGFGAREARIAAGRAARLALGGGARSVGIAGAALVTTALQPLAEGLLLGAYRFDKYLTGDRRAAADLGGVTVFLPSNDTAATARETLDAAIARARETARSVATARDLVNEPAGYLTPTRLAEQAESWARDNGLDVEVLDRNACRKLGMGLFLAVAQGSTEEPRFIHLAWKPPGTAARRRIVLVGKGVTFDSGGLSLKTNDGMLDMKTDMAGAAAVLSAVVGAARERLAVEVHAIAACTENMPSGSSYKLGDVITSMAGKTVEITNTDAEGRLTLADALTFALGLAPDAVLDFATLTGACVVALGPHTAGVMSNDEALAAEWLAAADAAGEDVWRLPLPPRLADQLKSEIADMKNTGERWGGALTAGLFLKEFVGQTPWVHVDLAGPASTDKELGHVAKGGTGFGVATILELLRRAAAARS